MLRDVGDRRALDARADVVPADVRARRVVAPVEAVARLGGEVDAADERDAVVDDDRLLVVAVHRPLLRVERALDLRAAHEAIAHLPHVSARGTEERQRRACPHEDAHVDALRQLGRAGCGARAARRRARARSRARSASPSGGCATRGAQRLRDRRQRLRAVDEDLERVAGPRRRVARRPPTGRRLQRLEPADPREAPPVVAADLLRDLLAEPAFDGEERLGGSAAAGRAPLRSCGSGRRSASRARTRSGRRRRCRAATSRTTGSTSFASAPSSPTAVVRVDSRPRP